MKTLVSSHMRRALCTLFVTLPLLCGCPLLSPHSDEVSSQAPVVEKVLKDARRHGHHTAVTTAATTSEPPEPQQIETAEKTPQTDITCSWFYFLCGSQAEFDMRNEEALDCYRKSLVCLPETRYVERKIPLMLLRMERRDEAEEWLGRALAKNPDDLEWLKLQSSAALENNHPEKAAASLRHILNITPDDAETTTRLAQIYLKLDQSEKAENLLKSFISGHSRAVSPRLFLSRLYLERNQTEEAISQLKKVLKIRFTDTVAWELAFLYMYTNRQQESEELLHTLLSRNSHNEQARFALVSLYLERRQFAKAERELQQLADFSSNTVDIDWYRANLLLRLGKNSEAVEILEKLLTTKKRNEAAWLLALFQFQQQNREAALITLKKIEPTSRHFEEGVYLQTKIYEENRELQRAITNLKHYIADTKHSSPLFYALISSLLQSRAKMREATEYLEQGHHLYPDNVRLLYELGLLYERQQRTAKALATMEEVLKLQPDHAEALNFLGYSWADRGEQLDRAYEYITRANRLKPGSGHILDSLGWVLFRRDNIAEAYKVLKKAQKRLPENALVYEHLGDVCSADKRVREARRYYRKALKISTDTKEKQRIDEKLKQLD